MTVTWPHWHITWQSHDLTGISHDCHMTSLVYHKTVSWPHWHITWQSHDLTGISHDSHMTSLAYHMTVTWPHLPGRAPDNGVACILIAQCYFYCTNAYVSHYWRKWKTEVLYLVNMLCECSANTIISPLCYIPGENTGCGNVDLDFIIIYGVSHLLSPVRFLWGISVSFPVAPNR